MKKRNILINIITVIIFLVLVLIGYNNIPNEVTPGFMYSLIPIGIVTFIGLCIIVSCIVKGLKNIIVLIIKLVKLIKNSNKEVK